MGIRVLMLLSAVLAAVEGGAAAATLTATNCAQLTNPDARLACFDQVFGAVDGSKRAEPAAPVEPPPVAVQPTPPPFPVQTPAQTPAEALPAELPTQPSTAVVSAAPSKTSSGDKRALPGGVFDRSQTLNLSSRIKAVREQEKQRMTFMLENDEIWIQTSPRDLPIKAGDDVTIKSGLMGGYMMRTSTGVSTRVKRIK